MQQILAKKIKAERERLGISVDDVAKAINASDSNIYALERGERTGLSLIKYLYFLRKKKVNLNKLFSK